MLLCLSTSLAWAQKKADPAPVAAAPGGPLEIVIGENISTGMPLSQAMQLLGIPDKVKVIRGTSADRDSIEISYPKHGLVIRAMTSGTQVEAIEAGPTFKGSFKSESGIKLGVKYQVVIGEYGLPNSLTAQVMRYPKHGLYFQLNNERLLSAKTYMQGTKLLDSSLMNP
ncbi:MAG: hypothetical protein GWO19_14920 [Nitrospinaceae bacterium]|nr:hypothetical protein [Nitrospinaceae bacterium]NIR55704.1 hypothetical protein [Nitrospinaceae bacterium]NIS86148.1 hypothetical protein [Nitrospinaceae bacterium]NIT82992.1 hypothetical protein [Nitrospinaceae bacterium]NIU45196.1 hypothetical protein [Nitrospinaceae bacterium]